MLMAGKCNDGGCLDATERICKRKFSRTIPQMTTGGDIFGIVKENGLFREHRVMVPPKAAGRVTFLAGPGAYKVLDDLMVMETRQKIIIHEIMS